MSTTSPPFPTLYDLLLPGTHDSAAYQTRPDLTSRATVFPLLCKPIRRACTTVQTDFALTQTLSIIEQLRAGARFLDIRVSKRPHYSGDPSFWTVHGMVLCVPLADVLAQINQFHSETSANPQVVIMVFRSYYLEQREELELERYVHHQLQHKCFEGDRNDLRNIPVHCLPRNIVAGLCNSRLNVEWGQDAWIDTYSADTKICFLRDTLSMTKHRELRNDLFVLGWTVTPSVVDVTMRVLSLGTLRPAVIVEAVKMNARFQPFLETYRHAMRQCVNVIFFDCFTSRLAQLVNELAQSSSMACDSTVS